MDLENVFVPFGGDTVQEPDIEHVSNHVKYGRVVVGLTNMTDYERAQKISDELGLEGVINKGQRTDPAESTSIMRSKSHGDMFRHAVEAYGFGKKGEKAVMVDDQLRNIAGAKEISCFTDYFWTYPNYFPKQHKGVLAMRPFEVPLGFGLIAMQKAARGTKVVRSLFNGTHGEW